MEEIKKKKHTDLTDVSGLKRDEVVPYYADLLVSNASDEAVKRINQLILSKWSSSGLLYIKERAWKIYYAASNRRKVREEFQRETGLQAKVKTQRYAGDSCGPEEFVDQYVEWLEQKVIIHNDERTFKLVTNANIDVDV